MKSLVADYSFNAALKTITIGSSEGSFSLEQILLITNVTTNAIIYNFADPLFGGSISNNVLTLDYNTTSMNNTDRLQIFVDKPNADQVALTALLQNGLVEIIRQLQSIRNDGGMADVSGRVRVAIETGSVGIAASQTLATVTTVGGVNNIAAIGSYAPQQMAMSQANQGWGNLRNKINIT